MYIIKIVLCCFFWNLPFNNQFTSCNKISKLFSVVCIFPVQFFWLHPAGCKVETISHAGHVYSLVAYIYLLQKLSAYSIHDMVSQKMKGYVDRQKFSKVPKHNKLVLNPFLLVKILPTSDLHKDFSIWECTCLSKQ